jgi:glycerol dehydrogenase
MKRILLAPSRYVQGAGTLQKMGEHVARLGTNALLVMTRGSQERLRSALSHAVETNKVKWVEGDFQGECTRSEIQRLRSLRVKSACDVVVGVGGGKAIDMARVVANLEGVPLVVVPTIASTDAPCSSLSVVYSEGGVFEEIMYFDRNPDLVLVDSAVIAEAPARFLVAGMGDALSTWFEARACQRSGAHNIAKALPTQAALGIARLCYDTLLAESVKAKIACETHSVTESLEHVIEANILLSGIGFESGGLAAAHSIHNGLTRLEETHDYVHGEKVAFGVLVQLVLENAPMAELSEVIRYCRSVGLPTTLGELGVDARQVDRIRRVAEAACAPDECIHHMPCEISVERVHGAILVADRLGCAPV